MRNADIEILERVAALLSEYIPTREYGLFQKYLELYERLKATNNKEKQNYQENAEYFHEATRKWR